MSTKTYSYRVNMLNKIDIKYHLTELYLLKIFELLKKLNLT